MTSVKSNLVGHNFPCISLKSDVNGLFANCPACGASLAISARDYEFKEELTNGVLVCCVGECCTLYSVIPTNPEMFVVKSVHDS